ncbi:malonyl-ACP O-methyltransferase BioC [Brevibacillus choshinensis]|uniref:Malonyl-[acyl-carrier protein] O-methyltransferase n=1 Tax=Brevibacillus choshinensis TaxID=54911 RepID=A0ABX7FMA1_BRECH|nr:malonyl-ACP O-methyltransferase BioC [Brevibacillus choshinensis]QRG67383.1 malonyl-ACP O-methyltransferase BioC [Brevibacillus choshinensis]
MSKTTVGNRFSVKACTYDQYALVQKKMAERLQEWTVKTAMPEVVTRLLEVGCGTGGLTSLLRRHYPSSRYLAMDMASGMLLQAKERLRKEGLECELLQADIEEWVWEQESRSWDLIVSGACFQWLLQPAETLKEIGRLLRPGAPLLFSTFGPRTFEELHASFRYAHLDLGQNDVRHGLSFCSGAQWEAMLAEAGFEEMRVSTQQVVLTYPSVLDFLHAVKAVGANASQDRAPGLGSRGLLIEMMKYYERTYASDEGVPVTYDLLYIQAKKKQDSVEKHGIIGGLTNLIPGECFDYGAKRNRNR